MSLVRILLCLGLLGSCDGRVEPGTGTRPAPAPPEAQQAMARARELFLAEEPALAVEELRRVVSLAPDWGEARLQLGKLLLTLCAVRFSTATFDRACLDQAVAELERAAELAPESAEAAYWTARALAKVPRVPEALQRLEAALALDPRHGPAWKELGLILAAEGDVRRAKDCLTRARELLPRDDEVLLNLGMLVESEERLEEAREIFLRATEVNPAHPGPLTRLVWIHQRLGDGPAAEHARAELERVKEFGKRLTQATQRFEADRRDVGACLGVAELYLEMGMVETARSWAERALRLGPDSAAAHEFLGELGAADPGRGRPSAGLRAEDDGKESER